MKSIAFVATSLEVDDLKKLLDDFQVLVYDGFLSLLPVDSLDSAWREWFFSACKR
jgi:hypothetical protein